MLLLACYMISFVQETVMGFVQGLELGYNIASYQEENQLRSQHFVSVDMRPTYDEMQPNELNLKDSTEAIVIPQTAVVLAFRPAAEVETRTWTETAVYIIRQILSFVIIFGFFFLVVVFVRLILSFQRSHIFGAKNIRRFQIIGIGFLILALCNTICSGIDFHQVQQAVQLSRYEIVPKIIDWEDIIIGLVILVMNNVLRIATQMKNENDLTI